MSQQDDKLFCIFDTLLVCLQSPVTNLAALRCTASHLLAFDEELYEHINLVILRPKDIFILQMNDNYKSILKHCKIDNLVCDGICFMSLSTRTTAMQKEYYLHDCYADNMSTRPECQ